MTGPTATEETFPLWRCDRCGDWAEVEPGGECEVCCEGTIHVVQVVPVELLAVERARSKGLEEALREIDVLASWGPFRNYEEQTGHLKSIRELAEKALSASAREQNDEVWVPTKETTEFGDGPVKP